jgi:hypothetical protein
MPRIVSILHHPILPVGLGRLAEEDNLGWHFRSAKALARYGGYKAIAARPSGSSRTAYKVIDRVAVVLTPSTNLSPSPRIWKWSWMSSALVELAEETVKRGFLPYVHEYRALNSELVIRRVTDHSMILQHHGSLPPSRFSLREPLGFVKELSRLRFRDVLRSMIEVFVDDEWGFLNVKGRHVIDVGAFNGDSSIFRNQRSRESYRCRTSSKDICRASHKH